MDLDTEVKLTTYNNFAATGHRSVWRRPFQVLPPSIAWKRMASNTLPTCAWDALRIPAALHKAATAHSRCAQPEEPFHLNVGLQGPEASDWLFYCLVPAAQWWDDIVFT
jgi:hypothetical protein